MNRLGFYGGSFNPIRIGHQTAVLRALEVANLDGLWIAPVYKHPYGKDLAPFEDRLLMCNHAAEIFHPDAGVVVSAVEKHVYEAGGKGHTSETLKYILSLSYAPKTIVLIVGSDVAQDMPTWEGYDVLMQLVQDKKLEILPLSRPEGASSTIVRARIKAGWDVSDELSTGVRSYIEHRGLYR